MNEQFDFDYINRIFSLDWYNDERLEFQDSFIDPILPYSSSPVVYSEFGYDWNACGVCTNSKILHSERKGKLTVILRIAQNRNGFGCSLETIDEVGFAGFLPAWEHCKRQTQWEAVADLISHTDDRKVRKIIRNFSSDLRQLSLF